MVKKKFIFHKIQKGTQWKYISPQRWSLLLLEFYSSTLCMPACWVISVVSHSVRPYGLQPARLLCPWDSPGKNTEVGCCALFPGILLTQGSNPADVSCIYLHWQVGSLPLVPPGKSYFIHTRATILFFNILFPALPLSFSILLYLRDYSIFQHIFCILLMSSIMSTQSAFVVSMKCRVKWLSFFLILHIPQREQVSCFLFFESSELSHPCWSIFGNFIWSIVHTSRIYKSMSAFFFPFRVQSS